MSVSIGYVEQSKTRLAQSRAWAVTQTVRAERHMLSVAGQESRAGPYQTCVGLDATLVDIVLTGLENSVDGPLELDEAETIH